LPGLIEANILLRAGSNLDRVLGGINLEMAGFLMPLKSLQQGFYEPERNFNAAAL